MFSTLRNRFGIPGVISVIALVFALVGGAFAANNLGGSGKGATASAKKKALKGPRGPRGPKGTTGAAGPAGPQGPAGANGKDGANGSNGAPGAPGQSVTTTPASVGECPAGGTKFTSASGTSKVCNGEEGEPGAPGEPGEPWTAGGTLPPGETETGGWAFGQIPKDAIAEGQAVLVPISFSLPLSRPLTEAEVHYIGPSGLEVTAPFFEEIVSTACLGSPDDPEANPGHLCIYAAEMFSAFSNSGLIVDLHGDNEGTSISGALLRVALEPELDPNSNYASGLGTWAVTAPTS